MLGRLVPRVARYLTARVPRYVARPLLMSVAGTGIYAITQSGMAACIMQVDPEQEPAKLRVLEEYGEDKPFKGLNDTTRKNLYNLLGFLGSRDDVVATARACLPHSYMDQFRSFKMEEHMRQKTLDGTRSVRDYDELRAVADAALLPFETLMRSLVRRAGLEPDSEAMHEGKPLPIDKSQNFRVLTIAPAKSRVRCDEKAAKEYDGEFDRIVDCVRCSVVVETEEQLVAVATFLRDHSLDPALLDEPPAGDGGNQGYTVFVLSRFKNRYTAPLFNGYRDGLYNISLALCGKCWVVCEVQLHLAAVLSHKEESHHHYEYFREYFSGNNDAVEKRMVVLDKVRRASSPDELLRTALAGTDEDELKALDTLFDRGMLGDYTLLVLVNTRLLELVPPEDEAKVAKAKLVLGDALWRAGRYGDAEPVLQEAVLALKGILGEDDEDTLWSMSSLAVVFKETGRKDKAEEMYMEVLAVQKVTLGEEHTKTLGTKGNLALLIHKTGRMGKAEEMYKEVLAMQKATLGEEHQETLRTTGNLANLYKQTDRKGEAEQMFKELLAVRQRTLGGEHVYTIIPMCFVVLLLHQTGRQDEAEPLYKQVLARARLRVGDDYPDSLECMSGLALCRAEQAKAAEEHASWGEAAAAYREAADLRAREKDDDEEVLQWRAAAEACEVMI